MRIGKSVGSKKCVVHVLIAHRNPSVRQQLREVIEQLGDVVVVSETSTGAETLRQTINQNPEVVILAEDLPDHPSVRLIRSIKAKRPRSKVIIRSDGMTTRDEAFAAGVDGFFDGDRGLIEILQKVVAEKCNPRLSPVVHQPKVFNWKDHRLGIGIGAGLGVGLLASLILIPRVAFPAVALAFGLLSFLYGLKYYLSIALILTATAGGPNGNGNGLNGVFNGLGAMNGIKKRPETKGRRKKDRERRSSNGIVNGNGYRFKPEEQPFISIHLPLYNESRVVGRLLEACTRLDYQNYEVLVADDSTDKTIEDLEKWAKHPKVRISHRINRTGFKGAALQHAMEVMDPRTQYIAVFDADFIPPPDVLHQFLSYFYGVNGNNGYDPSIGGELRLIDESLAVVQGYQWHILNASENWITRAIRTEFSGSYVVERPSQEVTGGMKMISGSVFMIRADLLRRIGWGTSITEDWELTIRLYLDGYRVLYSPFIQAPAECVSDFKQLARQRMRWAEGHTFNVKRYLLQVLSSKKLTSREKLEFIYYAPYYMQSVFFIIGTLSWFAGEIILRTSLPFWTETLGWSLVFTNTFALIAMNIAGLFLERGVRRNAAGLLSFVLLTFLLVPYQAYAAMKGLLEPHEGGWHRTDKTGVITEVVDKLGLGRRMRRLLPKPRRRSPDLSKRLGIPLAKLSQRVPKPLRRLSRKFGIAARTASGLLICLILLAMFAVNTPTVQASPDAFYLRDSTAGGAWYNVDWSYRKRITIYSSKVDSDLTNFPVLINLSSDAQLAASAQSDGGDILFTLGDGTTKLDHEIEVFTSGTGELVAWVEVPDLSSTVNTILYMYYGNATVADQWNISGTWNSDFRAVWHLKEDPTETPPQFLDSTSNPNDGTAQPVGQEPTQTTAKIDGGLQFDDTNERHVTAADHTSLKLATNITISAWVKTSDTESDVGLIVNKWGIANENRNYWLGKFDASTLAFYVDDTQNVTTDLSLINGDGEFHLVTGVADVTNSLLRIYVDGDQKNTAAYDGTSLTGTSDLHIGSGSGQIEQEWDGIIDEVRVVGEALPGDWIKASFENQNAPSSFYGLGDQETSGISPTGKEMTPSAGSVGATMLFDGIDDDIYWYTETAYPTGKDNASIVAGTYRFNMYFSQTPQLPSDWYHADWDYRKQITIDPLQVVADETNFPVLVSFSSDADLAAHAQDDHDDILFTSSDGVTKLSHEIEEFNGSTGKLVAWVKLDISGSLDTVLYMYYGNDTVGNQEDINGVWSNGFAAVYHLNNNPGPGNSGDILDSTSNNKHGTAEASMESNDLVPGQIGNGIDFDGGDDYVWAPDPLDGNTMTISAWIKSFDFSQSWHTIAQRDDQESEWWYDWQFYARANDTPSINHAVFRVDVDDNDDANEEAESDIVLSINTWYYLVGTYDSTDLKFYRDGTLRDTDTHAGTIPDSGNDMWIAMNDEWGEPFEGIIDEVRVSTTPRTASWIETSYHNQFNPVAFYKSIGSQEDIPAVDIVV
ncbi:MAG: DUF2341 domain-containing protein, partial [Anaerolineales bacterium]